MGVSKNIGTPKSSILIGFSLINHPFWGSNPPIFGNTHMICSTRSSDMFDKPQSFGRVWGTDDFELPFKWKLTLTCVLFLVTSEKNKTWFY